MLQYFKLSEDKGYVINTKGNLYFGDGEMLRINNVKRLEDTTPSIEYKGKHGYYFKGLKQEEFSLFLIADRRGVIQEDELVGVLEFW